ncbi:MdlB ABC-type multidrug transport system, ATPase and permease components [Rhabdaerophilaceae bacterium]
MRWRYVRPIMSMNPFRWLERLVDPIMSGPADQPNRLAAFLGVQTQNVRWPLFFLFLLIVADALLDTLVPFFIGQLINLLTNTPRETIFVEAWPTLLGMALVILILRPAVFLVGFALGRLGIEPGWQSRMRWQYYERLSGNSLGFFQSDFAGRLANRVMQTGGAVRQATASFIQAVVYILFYGISSTALIMAQNWRMAIPIGIWFCLYIVVLRGFLPQQRNRAQRASESRSMVIGKIVDAFGNIATLKLFGEKSREDAYMSAAIREATDRFQDQQRLQIGFSACLALLSASTITATGAIGLWLWHHKAIEIGSFVMAMTLVLSLVRASGWIAWEIAGIMENIGVVQEGMESITAPVTMQDPPGARDFQFMAGQIDFDAVRFGYDKRLPVLQGISITVKPGEKIGLVGRSGAGKSTLVNLLLRFNSVTEGQIRIDGQDIAGLKQESLRRSIAMVTQDTSLLHRSIRENILYGRPEASEAELEEAIRLARADGFISRLSDWKNRTALDAHVGERGVKLSGGQRQRIAIARVILKNAPILVLDEATSALDSEVEAAIQESLVTLMEGKTVIAIAHRLSTLQIMDRLVVLDEGRVLEEGTHAELIAKGGLYAELWSRQSGGFIVEPKRVRAAE